MTITLGQHLSCHDCIAVDLLPYDLYTVCCLCCVGNNPNLAFRVGSSAEYLSSSLNLEDSTWMCLCVLAVMLLHLQSVHSLWVFVSVLSEVHPVSALIINLQVELVQRSIYGNFNNLGIGRLLSNLIGTERYSGVRMNVRNDPSKQHQLHPSGYVQLNEKQKTMNFQQRLHEVLYNHDIFLILSSIPSSQAYAWRARQPLTINSSRWTKSMRSRHSGDAAQSIDRLRFWLRILMGKHLLLLCSTPKTCSRSS